MADVESKSIPHELPSSHWLKATGQCVLERYLSATMLLGYQTKMADLEQAPPEPDGQLENENKPPSPVQQENTQDELGNTTLDAVSVSDPSLISGETEELLKKTDTDPYNEDEAELRFLHSKPTCFIVIGKPGSGKSALARRLAMEWKCELINPTELLQQAVEMQTEFGLKCQEILVKGEAVPEEMIIKMIEDKVNSAEVTHHGYVLDDFPCLSEANLAVNDQLELIRNWKLRPDFIINLKIPDKDLERRRIGQKIDPVTGEIYIEDIYNPERPKEPEKTGEGEEEEEEEEAEEEETSEEDGDIIPELPAEVLERIITRPEDLPDQVENNIRKYKTNLLRILEEYMADHDQQYLIEMDANQTAKTLFNQLIQRLNCFVLRYAAVPQRLHDPEEEEIPEDIETDELMRSLAPKQMVAPRFRWRRSKWLRTCPVALQEGNIIPGKPDLAVSFLDKVYCLSSHEALEKFLKNPRPYLLPPQPRPPSKISVLGPPCGGKTTFCHLLAQKYGSTVLDMNELIKPRLEVEKKKAIEQAKKDATEGAIAQVKAKIKEQLEAEQAAKEAAEAAAREQAEREAEEREAERQKRIEAGEEEEEEEQEEGEGEGEETESPKETEDETAKETTKEPDPSVSEEQQEDDEEGKKKVADETPSSSEEKVAPSGEGDTGEMGVTAEKTEDSIVSAQERESVISPSSERKELAVPEVDETHPDVIAIVEKAVQDAEKNVINLNAEVYMEILEEAIRDAEKKMRESKPDGPINGGWILDNFPNTRDQWNQCIEKNMMPDDVIVLKDKGENSNYLLKRWYSMNREEVDGQIRKRVEEEEERRRVAEEERRRKLEEERLKAEEEAKRLEEEERQRKAEEEAEREGDSEEGEGLESEREGDGGTEGEGGDEEGADEQAPNADLGKTPESTSEATKTDTDQTEQSDQSSTEQADQTQSSVDNTEQADQIESEKEVEQADQKLIDEKLLDQSTNEEKLPDQSTSEDEDQTETEVTKTEVTEGEESRVEFEDLKEQEEKLPEGPELEVYKDKKKEYEKEIGNIIATITGGSNVDPLQIDLEDVSVEEMLDEVVTSMERQYKYQGWEYQGMDVDEEEEDLEADAGANEEEEEEQAEGEEEDPNRNKKKPLGDTNHYCPVALKETNVLYPGNPEVAAKYREKVYYLSSTEAREKFLADPEEYLSKNSSPKTPPVRILLMGPRGAGKTLHGRQIAKKLGLFHISFKDRLQELIMHKTKKRIGPDYEEDNEPEPEEEEEDEEEAAITDPEGKAVKEKSDASKTTQQSDSKDSQEAVEEVEYTEEEEAIKNNIENEEALSNEVLDNILPQWWHKEPFKSTGFILEGFPRTPEECRYLAESGLFPDTAVIIAVDDSDVIGRLLPPRLDKWKVKRDKRLAKRQKKKEKAQKKREEAIQKRREELQKEAEEKRKERAAEREAEKAAAESDEEAEEEEEEEEEEEDIEAVLAEEFEEEEEEEDEDEEQEEDAVDRMRNELADIFDQDTNKLAAVQDTLEEVLIPRIDIDGGRKPHIVRYILNKKLKPTIEFRHSVFERVYPISEKLARKMLLTGYKQPSRFGRWCPVKVKEGDCIQTMSGPGYTTYPCLYRSQIYFISSTQAREEFTQDPVKFVSQPTPKPVVPIKIAVIGPPKSGKTTLANRFAEEYGLLRLSIGEAMRMVIASQPKSHLSKEMQRHLIKGLTIPDELAVQALEICLLDMKCQTRGYVLDGYPMTKKQVDLMTERCLIPVRVFELDVKSKEIMVRGTRDRITAARDKILHDSAQILAIKLAAFNREIAEIRDWYSSEHMNYKLIDGKRSKWWVWNTTLEYSRESVRQIQTYLDRIAEGKAASIADMCVTPDEFLSRMGDYNQYCPVSLALRGELVDCSTNKTLEFAVEFRGHYYKCAGQEEKDQFLAEPEKYVPPLAPHKLPPPSMLPRRRKPEEVKATATIELKGYCPVTYLDGKCRYEAIKPGKSDFVVEYREKYWYCETEEKLLKFMKLPEQYSSLKLPHKLPPTKEDISVAGLPMLGYMEQTSATALIKAMTACGNVKPKYPFLSASRSALFYIAYHLKAFNPKSSDYVRKKYKKKLERFEETCELIKYLGDNMTVRYKDPEERPTDFDNKIQTFFALRGIEPTPTWIS